MRINLQKNWLDPEGVLRRKQHNPHEVPDSYKSELPTGTEIEDEGVVQADHTVAKADAPHGRQRRLHARDNKLRQQELRKKGALSYRDRTAAEVNLPNSTYRDPVDKLDPAKKVPSTVAGAETNQSLVNQGTTSGASSLADQAEEQEGAGVSDAPTVSTTAPSSAEAQKAQADLAAKAEKHGHVHRHKQAEEVKTADPKKGGGVNL